MTTLGLATTGATSTKVHPVSPALFIGMAVVSLITQGTGAGAGATEVTFLMTVVLAVDLELEAQTTTVSAVIEEPLLIDPVVRLAVQPALAGATGTATKLNSKQAIENFFIWRT